MIDRYTLPEMGKVWSQENKFKTWWVVEREVCRVQTERGVVSQEDLKKIEEKADFEVSRILEIEEEVKHDVIAFLTNISENIDDPASRHIHKGMTSSDLLDTALALQLAEAGDLILGKINKLIEVLEKRAEEFKDQLMIGRTHGIHAEPITFGLKLLLWRDEIERHLSRFEKALKEVKVGQISGAVGTYQHLEPEVEEMTCKNLGLTPAPVSNQVIQRDRHAAFVSAIALLGASLGKIATEIRHLQRTEVLEAEEYFSKGQKGSSAMPHKRNPIKTERICGMARLLRGFTQTAMENVPLWHERDISHSSAERVILPDSCITIDFMLRETINVVDNLMVYPENMKKNLEQTRGLIYSQEILLALVEKGLTREKAYQMVQRNAMQCWREGDDFKELLLKDDEILKYLEKKEIEQHFSSEKILERIDYIFDRYKKSTQ
ncbi:MAG: adenylosuccinate lyase [Candidatus Marinimicrobia bacterium]|nr:adenylosuccinate lyase [Candidatus Neomarinimicrobiota bacterium]